MSTKVDSFIEDLNGGVFKEQLSAILSQVAGAVVDHGRKGKITVELDLKQIGSSHQVEVFHNLKYQRPTSRGSISEVMEQSIQWLHQYGVPYAEIIMRGEGDYTPDHELKRQWAEQFQWNAENVLCVLDDRRSVVGMWRDLGLTCLQVAPGDF